MTRYRFLCGAEMAPEAVLASFPGARFVARAKASSDGGEIWGILIVTTDAGDPIGPEGEATGSERPVVTDDGRSLSATAPHGWRPGGEAPAVLAAARYWELPPSYVRQLPGAAASAD